MINTKCKIQPQAIDLEEAILGAIMLETNCIDKIMDIINENCFYKEQHKLIYQSILSLNNKSNPIDILTVTNELKANGNLEVIGGAYYITQLTNRVSSTANIEFRARVVYQKYLQREIIKLGNEISENSYSDEIDIFEIIETTQNILLNLVKFDTSKISTINEAVKGVYKIIEHNQNNNHVITGIGTGFTEIDDFTSGLQKGDLIIIAGETSQGKTSLALNITKNACVNFNKSCVIYSLEMTKEQLAGRILSSESGLNSHVIMRHKLSIDGLNRINAIANTVTKSKIYFDDSSNSNIDSIIKSIRAMVIKYNIDFVVIDYLQLVSNNIKGLNKEGQVADTTRKLKNIAKELNICVILISQLSRDKNNPKPILSRLRDSGQIEEAADMVIFVYRPDTYGKGLPEPFEMYDAKGKAFIDIAKGRNTGVKCFLLEFEKETTTFKNCIDLSINVNNNDLKF